ncbi:response regulator transcription factor [Pedobacter frigidisoli]|uniref:Response regulator transcription factor n=1 Tax=Pedobacter frigidisoli TaxID=2530455 RepID=A0A4V2MMU3_9SPHI|nr:response regulator transcription factor [Pedobacter frigidisoli]TCD10132.1 response regulator transcription factor [Pedobacter frigidisoli]
MKIPIRVLLADDHALVRNGIIALLEDNSEIEVIAEASNSTDTISQLEAGVKPDIIIAGVNISTADGLQLCNHIKTFALNIKVIILTNIDQESEILKCFDAGASGYLLKNVNAAELIFAIKQIAIGFKYISTSIGIRLLTESREKSTIAFNKEKLDLNITKREIEILGLIADGYTNGEIADRLFTSKRTIEGNRQNLLDKTGKKNTAALINYVVRNGIID